MGAFPAVGACGQGLTNVSTINVFASHNAEEQSLVPGGFTLTRTDDLSKPVTVSFLVSGSARNGVDFKRVVGSIHFEVGSSEKTVLIIPVDDAEVEGNENLTLIISTGSGYILGNHISDTIIIADNDFQSSDLQRIESAAFETLGSQSENVVSHIVRIYHSGYAQADISHGKLNHSPANETLLQTAVTVGQNVKKPGIQSMHTVLHRGKLGSVQVSSAAVSSYEPVDADVRSIPTIHPTRLVLIMICLAGLAWRSLSKNNQL